MRAIAGQLGGTYADNPLWWAKRVITVHPLGGAPWARHAGEGLCDEYGEVYGHPASTCWTARCCPDPSAPTRP
jgi:cholesterol oxidase